LAAILRKHSTAIIALAVYHFVFFFPVIFMDRVVSPNDVFYNFDPWALYKPEGVRSVQNALMNDPATGYLPMIAMVKRGPETFHWNPYLAGGIPGFGSAAAASFTPFVLLPILLVPLTWVYTAILFLKINVTFWFAYLWLREERLGKRGAAIGAIVLAVAGVYAVRWLWQMTNATALYPALLWFVRRTFNGKRSPIVLVVLVALSYILAGFPAAIAYGAYLALAYALFLAIRFRRIPLGVLGKNVLGVALALAIAVPSLVPFAQLLRRTGYLAVREQASFRHFYPLSHLRAFVQPEYLGNQATKNWQGSPDLGILNNYFEATIYLGIAALVLIALSVMNRRARARWFWLIAFLVICGAMFGVPLISTAIGSLPGFKYSALARVVILLPIPAAYLAAAGAGWLLRVIHKRRTQQLVAAAIAILAAADLAVFAGRFYPYLDSKDAVVPATPTIRYLQAQPKPFRVAPFFNYFWPNAAELFAIEDLRSHFSSEANYRAMLERIDKNARLQGSTVVEFNGLTFQFDDPFVGMLGVRYFIEHKAIDIIRWTTHQNTVPGVKETGTNIYPAGTVLQRTIRVEEEPFYAIELPMSVEKTTSATPLVNVALLKFGLLAWSRDFTPDDIKVMNKIYIPLRPYALRGEEVTIRIGIQGMQLSMLRGENATPGEAQLFYGRVTTPVVFDRELPDGRIFLNLAEVPRFRAVSKVRKLTDGEVMVTKSVDFAKEAVISDPTFELPQLAPGDASIALESYAPGRQRLTTDAGAPFFLASSEKLTPELAIHIDGKRVDPVLINVLFAGVMVPAGQHEVVFSRRIARGWWWLPALAVAAIVAIMTGERFAAARRRREARAKIVAHR
jgi:hypothetical protein